jgi:C4-dicarboxylate-binding protein DctP
VFSAKLWEAGVHFSYSDHQYVGQYVPLVSETFWAKVTPEQQKIMLDLWTKNIPTYRSNAAAAQTRARKALEEHGVGFTDPSREELAANRKIMQADVATLIKDAKLSPEIVRLTDEAIGGKA